MKIFNITEPIFNMGVRFFWDCTVDEFFNYHEMSEEIIKHVNSKGITLSVAGRIPDIWILDEKDEWVVVHEIVHATRSILEGVWVVYWWEEEETYAYYQEFLYNCYLEWVRKKNGKIGMKFGYDWESYSLSFTENSVEEVKKKLWLKKWKSKLKEKS